MSDSQNHKCIEHLRELLDDQIQENQMLLIRNKELRNILQQHEAMHQISSGVGGHINIAMEPSSLIEYQYEDLDIRNERRILISECFSGHNLQECQSSNDQLNCEICSKSDIQ